MTDHPEFPTGSHFADSWPNGKSKHPAGPFVNEQRKYKTELKTLEALSDQDLLTELMKIRYVHVSSSANLPVMMASSGSELSLQPTGKLINSGFVPFVGEMELGIMPGIGVNEKAVSMFATDISYGSDYLDYMRRASQPWQPNSPPMSDTNYINMLPIEKQRQLIELRKRIEEDRNKFFNTLSDQDKRLITNPFSIVWGVGQINTERIHVMSSITGEAAFEGVPLPEGSHVFVEDPNLERTSKEFSRLDIKAKVLPFSYLYAVQVIKKSYSPDRYGGIWWTTDVFDNNSLDPERVRVVAKGLAEYVASLSTMH